VTTATLRPVLLAVALCGAAPGLARAQEAAPPTQEDPRAAKFKDVERGFFIGFEPGMMFLFKTPTDDRAKFPYAGAGGGAAKGVSIGLTMGVDLGPHTALSLFALATEQRASSSYGAFDLQVVGLDLRWALLGRRDRNDWERFFVYVHGRGGYGYSHPKDLFGDAELLLGAGVGAEYYTQLRHFAVGLQLDGLYAVQAKSPGLAVTPTLRYTF
jgi:hypothetical protein